MTYETLESQVTAWAATQPAIRAILIVGSRARSEYDAWSDLDLVIFTTERDRYANDSDWLRGFGDLWLLSLEKTGGGDFEWYAVYDGGLKLDAVLFQVEAAAPDLDALLAIFPYQGVIGRGVRVLFDRAGSPRIIELNPFTPPAPPTQTTFDNLTQLFLIDAISTAKFIARGDLWRGQHRLSNTLRHPLLQMIEWHAHGRDTWYSGRNLNTWADPRVLELLPQTFALYEPSSMKQALLAMLDLFRLVGEETAARFGYSYPAAHAKVTALIQTILSAI